MRTIIDIPAESLKDLDNWALRHKISRAEAVRRAVDGLLARVAQPKDIGFGLWRTGETLPPERDGLVLQQAMREEWPQ